VPGRSDYSAGDLLEPPPFPWLSPRLGAVDEQAVSESVCQWCGRQISPTDVVCTGCGAPITHGAPDPKPAPARPAPPAPGAAAPRPQAAAATAQRTAAPPSKNVHTAKAVSLIASAVSAGEAGVIIRFFTPQGQLITEIRPGSPAYDEALRLALG